LPSALPPFTSEQWDTWAFQNVVAFGMQIFVLVLTALYARCVPLGQYFQPDKLGFPMFFRSAGFMFCLVLFTHIAVFNTIV
jgi:hypothetical protein